MCGLYGFSGKSIDKNLITILALQNITRGEDSSGIYLENDKSYWHNREVGTADLLFENILTTENHGIVKNDINIVIGHNRAKTVGTVKVENAHPFVMLKKQNSLNINDIVLAHNGTLRDYHRIVNHFSTKFKHNEIDVDSQLFAYYFARFEDVKILNMFEGAAALLWKNINKTEMYAFRNDDRPLHYGMVGENMYISSVDTALNLIGATDIKQFESRKIYTIEDGKIKNISQTLIHSPIPAPVNNNAGFNRNRNNNTPVIHIDSKKLTKFSEKELNKYIKKIRSSKKFNTFSFNMNNTSLVIKDDIMTFTDKYGNDIVINTNTFYDEDFQKPKITVTANQSLRSPITTLTFQKGSRIDFINCIYNINSEASEDEDLRSDISKNGSLAIRSDSNDLGIFEIDTVEHVVIPTINFIECHVCNGTGYVNNNVCDTCHGFTEIQIQQNNNSEESIEIIPEGELLNLTDIQMDEIKEAIDTFKTIKNLYDKEIGIIELNQIDVAIASLEKVLEEQLEIIDEGGE